MSDGLEGHRKLLGLISLGCPKNTVDSERLLGELRDRGWEFTDNMHEADCLVVNTCGFIEDARLESEEALAEICIIKNEKPNVILVATGCLPQRLTGKLKKQFPDLDLIVGVGNLPKLPGLLEEIIAGKRSIPGEPVKLDTPGHATLSSADDPRLRLTPPWTAYVKIAEGCDHSCAFCTIPFIKGPHISRPIADIVAEAKHLAADGVRELILISQDTTAYGSDIGTNLRNLLGELDKIDRIDWIRLHYLYPSKLSESLLDTIVESRRILPYFDIPIQHISPAILRAMDRLAPDIDVLDIVRRIRARFDGRERPACIRTTLMVGFPGETEEDVGAMLDFLHDARIDRLTIFQFSPEEGTPAAHLPDQIPAHTKDNRMNLLMAAQQEISLEINEEWVGRTLEVLLEGETDDGRRVGRSYRDAPEIDGLVFVDGVPENVQSGSIVEVRITSALEYDLEGIVD